MLYSDEGLNQPVWLEHPVHGRDVDVVAVPLAPEIASKYQLFPINDLQFNDKFGERVSDDAFIVGYPFHDYTFAALPIWKKASIATEPDVNIDGLPKMLVDTV